jgi:hypothetical protein
MALVTCALTVKDWPTATMLGFTSIDRISGGGTLVRPPVTVKVPLVALGGPPLELTQLPAMSSPSRSFGHGSRSVVPATSPN